MNASQANVREVNVDGRLITVHRLTLPMSMKLDRLVKEVSKLPITDIEELVSSVSFYPPMVSCSTGDLPTREEFLTIPLEDINKWYEAVDELNPRLLPQPPSKDTLSDTLEKKDN